MDFVKWMIDFVMKNVEEGGCLFVMVIVCDGEIVVESLNFVV